MTQVSRRIIKKETEDKIFSLFWESLANCSDCHIASEFINDLLTPTEKIMLAKRLAIAQLLLKGYPYLTIKSYLKVSSPTIGAVALMLKTKGNGLRKILTRVINSKKWKNIFEELGEIAVDLVGKGKGGNWKAAKTFEYQRKMAKQSPL